MTRHLALSRVLMFLFDPTQDMRFRRLCSGKTADPQMLERAERLERERPVLQDAIFAEAAQRVRRYVGLAQSQKHSRPLIVVVTKFDCWRSLLGSHALPPTRITNVQGSRMAMNFEGIEETSRRVRSLLRRVAPEIAAAAEGFASQVLYVPVSATGCSPETDPASGALGFRPGDMQPIWAEVPLLYAISRWLGGLVPFIKPAGGRNGGGGP